MVMMAVDIDDDGFGVRVVVVKDTSIQLRWSEWQRQE